MIRAELYALRILARRLAVVAVFWWHDRRDGNL